MAATRFGLGSFLVRWVGALVLVLLTFNPTQYSYFAWVRDLSSEDLPLKLLGGVVLLIGYVILIRATLNSIGGLGLVLTALLFGALVWVMIDYGLLDLGSFQALAWVGLVVLATILAVGVSWSHVRRRLTGQYDTDEIEG